MKLVVLQMDVLNVTTNAEIVRITQPIAPLVQIQIDRKLLIVYVMMVGLIMVPQHVNNVIIPAKIVKKKHQTVLLVKQLLIELVSMTVPVPLTIMKMVQNVLSAIIDVENVKIMLLNALLVRTRIEVVSLIVNVSAKDITKMD
jgi:hypothetical protein